MVKMICKILAAKIREECGKDPLFDPNNDEHFRKAIR
jgi:hypothetical protein